MVIDPKLKIVGLLVLLLRLRTGLAALRSRDVFQDVDCCSRSGGSRICGIDEWLTHYRVVFCSSS